MGSLWMSLYGVGQKWGLRSEEADEEADGITSVGRGIEKRMNWRRKVWKDRRMRVKRTKEIKVKGSGGKAS